MSTRWRGAVRDGDWKIVWTAALPQKVELFNLSDDRSEATNLASQDPDRVAKLQARITALAGEMAPPLLFREAIMLTFGAPPISAKLPAAFEAGD